MLYRVTRSKTPLLTASANETDLYDGNTLEANDPEASERLIDFTIARILELSQLLVNLRAEQALV